MAAIVVAGEGDVLVRVEDADGAVGWGEVASPSGPFYTAETVETCWTIGSSYLVPAGRVK